MPVNNEIGIKSTALPGELQKDPADRMIVATARKLAIPLVTADEKIIRYEYVKTKRGSGSINQSDKFINPDRAFID